MYERIPNPNSKFIHYKEEKRALTSQSKRRRKQQDYISQNNNKRRARARQVYYDNQQVHRSLLYNKKGVPYSFNQYLDPGTDR